MEFMGKLKARFTLSVYDNPAQAVKKGGWQGMVKYDKACLTASKSQHPNERERAFEKLDTEALKNYLEEAAQYNGHEIGDRELEGIAKGTGTEGLKVALTHGSFKAHFGNIADRFDYDGIKYAVEHGNIQPANEANLFGDTVLEKLAYKGGDEGVKLFLENGGKPYVPDPGASSQSYDAQIRAAKNEASAVFEMASKATHEDYKEAYNDRYKELQNASNQRFQFIKTLPGLAPDKKSA